MKFLLAEHISTALQSLKVSRSRTFLTTLGIAIGIASITTILTLAHGVSVAVNKQVTDIGGNVAIIRPGEQSLDINQAITSPVAQQQFSISTITEKDVDTIRRINRKNLVAPLVTTKSSLKAGDNLLKGRTVVATTPEFIKISDVSVKEGEFINEVSAKKVAVIGHSLALDLFGVDSPLGGKFTMRKTDFTVVGVLEDQLDPVNYNNVDLDNAVIIDFDDGKALHGGHFQIQQVNVKAHSSQDLAKFVDKTERVLTKAHGEKDFSILSGEDIARPTNDMFLIIAGVMTAIAAISLLVGGIGIMNIMLVSVAERTREIGIRKSVGASNLHVVNQFMIESLLIALFGGIFGYALGVLLAWLISVALYFDVSLDWRISLLALGVSMVVGILFGLYPAIRAARKNPIESLRTYR